MALRSSRALVTVGLLAWVLAACANPAPVTTPTSAPATSGQATTAPAAAPPSGSPIKVGVLDDVTGVGAIEGALMRISTDLVVEQTNATGGINGHPLQVIYADPKGDATQALQLATQLVQQDDVDVLAGGIFSQECLGVQGLAAKVGLVYLPLNGCANEQFSTQFCNRFSFRVFPV